MATNSKSSKHKRPLDSELKDSSISPAEMSIEGGLPNSTRKSSSKQNPPKVTQKDLAKAKSAQKAERKQAWNTWLAREENRWSPGGP
ncbi:uncharacterized protein ARMOST_04126 [Armillaria ostoyae]|uniref:Uncharacterized protein n=1 Tax=Armillaria ostoyae TaxID=47428 RepID=A0A284QWJ7_ARMOS|nr:uncharacterized protein ARMOST_04126 [Armillaria ostoyae]